MKNLLYQIESQQVDLQYCRSRWMYFTKAKEQLSAVMAPHLFYFIVHIFSNIMIMGASLKTSKTRVSALLAQSILWSEVGMCTINFLGLGLLIALNYRLNRKASDDLDDVAEAFYKNMNRNFKENSKNIRLTEFLDSIRVDSRNTTSLFSLAELDLHFIAQFAAALVPLFTLMNQMYEAKQDTENH
ncbi:hypothetical protein HDE_07900 [Halotydeus destructor]|nr:hypothetical protein HDE_07900 [Halotydeus destructor]